MALLTFCVSFQSLLFLGLDPVFQMALSVCLSQTSLLSVILNKVCSLSLFI